MEYFYIKIIKMGIAITRCVQYNIDTQASCTLYRTLEQGIRSWELAGAPYRIAVEGLQKIFTGYPPATKRVQNCARLCTLKNTASEMLAFFVAHYDLC